MLNASTLAEPVVDLPSWVPKEASTYLMHTEHGHPIRALARAEGVHASTVLRQVRAIETRREDPLVDQALTRLGRFLLAGQGGARDVPESRAVPTRAELSRQARRVLRRLCEPGAVLAVAVEMDNAVVVRESEGGDTTRRAVVTRAAAEAMALSGWIACDRPARISRYRITRDGRNVLNRLLAEAENRAVGLAEAQMPFAGPGAGNAGTGADRAARPASRGRFHAPETPLALLARRRDRSGRKFLSDDLVRAGERLHEDYEVAGLDPRHGQSWDRFLTAAADAPPTGLPGSGQNASRTRLLNALRDLGPGLGDVALRCCCYLEGLESAEREMGWSARSGKIVLRIALQRLRRHYDALGDGGAMLG